ncbi:EamA family transporter [Acetobacterium paludosum]|uniref:EamA family transporter n=1 Tax=Acetobacterium paludosum TaxID=52693 RepID=A0A923KT68_9FIRM|nr:EamA family transporter [Acetobacterium paludosum]
MLAAVLFGFNAPFSKLLINELSPLFLATLLYLGAGIGMTVLTFFNQNRKLESKEAGLTKKEMPYVMLMISLNIHHRHDH